jgi:hypothetical protein
MENEELYILWTNGDPITSEKVVLMYAHAGINRWWKDITIIIWGSPAKLVAENEEIQDKIKKMINDGVKFSACRACAEQLGVTEKLESMGIEVIYWGDPLTVLLKEDKKLLTI